MSLKIKLTSSICAFFLVLGLLIMGVWAAPSATINLGGSLTFTATDVYARVTGTVSGAETEIALETLNFTNTTDVANEGAKWSNIPLGFKTDGSEITITVTIENLAKDRKLYASINDIMGETENLTKGMKQGEDIYQGELIEIPESTGTGTSTVTITLSMKVTDVNKSLSEDATYGYNIVLNNPSEVPTAEYYEENNLIIVEKVEGEDYAQVRMIDRKTTVGEVVIPSYVNLDGTVYPVTHVADGAFGDFDFGVNITEIIFSNTITHIGMIAFLNCHSLESITIPGSVTSIGYFAFMGCSFGLERIEVSEGNSVYEDRDSNAIIDKESNTLILGCKNTEIPDSIETIGEAAFNDCRGLTEITIPNNVTSIGDFAFEDCSALTSVTIGNGVTSMGQNPFNLCFHLVEIKNESSVEITPTSFGLDSDRNPDIRIYKTGESKVTEDENGYVFYEYEYLNEDEETVIEYKLVVYRGNETELVLPDTFNGNPYSIRQYAFSDCSDLTSVTIGSGVTSIGKSAFASFGALKTITINATTPPTLENVYAIPNDVTEIRVPSASLEAYKVAENWSNFAAKMVGF